MGTIVGYGSDSSDGSGSFGIAPGDATIQAYSSREESASGFSKLSPPAFMREYGTDGESASGFSELLPSGTPPVPGFVVCCTPAAHPLPGRHLPRRLDYCYPYRRFRCII